MTELMDICKDSELAGPVVPSLYPWKTYALAMERPDTCPINKRYYRNIWRFHMSGLLNLGGPWPAPCDNWRDKQFQEQIIAPIIPCPLKKKKGPRLLTDLVEKAAWETANNPNQPKYAKLYMKHKKSWVMNIQINPSNCPREIVDSVKSAFQRAGLGKPF